MNDSETVIIDVREPNEYVESHIESAISMPLGKLKDDISKIIEHKNKPVLLSCQTGTRAASAGKILTKAGFEQVYVITGGMQAWETDYKLPVKISNTKKVKPKV